MTLSFRYFCISLSICCAYFAEVPIEISRQYQTSTGITGVFPADVDNDGFVNVMDFLYLLERWRNVCVETDLNFNAIVNIGDSPIVIGVCCKCNN